MDYKIVIIYRDIHCSMARKKQSKNIIEQLAKEFFKKKNPLYWLIGAILLIASAYFSQFDLDILGKSQPEKQMEGQTFNQAKSRLIELYKAHPEQKEFYCGCDFSWQGKRGEVDLASCGYQIRKNAERANRIEWEHVMPAYAFGNQLQCWQKGGRENCKTQPDYSEFFNVMEGDMHNLQPAIGEINGDRSNFRFSEFTKRFNQYGQCQFATDFKNRQVQPRNEVKGMIARTYLYMVGRYELAISDREKNLMNRWNEKYPPNRWECERNEMIRKIQGNDNQYITSKCDALLI